MTRRKGILLKAVEEVLKVHQRNRRYGTFLSNKQVIDKLVKRGRIFNKKAIVRAHHNLLDQELLERGKATTGYSGYRLIPEKEKNRHLIAEELLSELKKLDIYEDIDISKLERDCIRLQQLLTSGKKFKELMDLLFIFKEKSKEISDTKKAAMEMIGSFLSEQLSISITKSKKIEANKINGAFCYLLLGFLLKYNLNLVYDGKRFFEKSGASRRRRSPKTRKTEETIGFRIVEHFLEPRFWTIEKIRESDKLRPLLGRSTYRDISIGKKDPSLLIAVVSEEGVLLSIYDKDNKGITYLRKHIRMIINDLFSLSRSDLYRLRHIIDELIVSIPIFEEYTNRLVEILKEV